MRMMVIPSENAETVPRSQRGNPNAVAISIVASGHRSKSLDAFTGLPRRKSTPRNDTRRYFFFSLSSTAPAISGNPTVASRRLRRTCRPLLEERTFPTKPLRCRAAGEAAPVHRLRTDAHAVVEALQRQVFPAAPMTQLDERPKLLRPVARHAAADGEDAQPLLLQQVLGKVLKIEERIEIDQLAAFLLRACDCAAPRRVRFRIAERRHEDRHILLEGRLQDAALLHVSRCR